MTPADLVLLAAEAAHCKANAAYFIQKYCYIYDNEAAQWIPFKLWPEQQQFLETLEAKKKVAALKARQIGFTWVSLAFILHRMIFFQTQEVMVFSKRDDEAMELLRRLKGMWERLPEWARGKLAKGGDNDHTLTLDSGSRAQAFPTTGGRSYAATIVLVDEADYVPSLSQLLGSVQPTIDHPNGKLILVTTANKEAPISAFKGLYTGAKAGRGGYTPFFVPWNVRPGRDEAWYQERRQEILDQDGNTDRLSSEYPATDTEAMAANSANKRLAVEWLQKCYKPATPITNWEELAGSPALPGLVIYELPRKDARYAIGADPAKGNPNSDDSAGTVMDIETGREVAKIQGKIEMRPFADYLGQVAVFYHRAGILVEQNNHGHAVLLALRELGYGGLILQGPHGDDGWITSTKSKSLLYDQAAEQFRVGETTVRSFETQAQLASIEANTMKAPEGMKDDLAVSFVLAIAATLILIRRGAGGYSMPDERTGRIPAGVAITDYGTREEIRIDRMVF